ncbi:MAG: peptidase M24 [Methanobacterium sp.]|nr:MAG: peptidase M24 [Methanobacterium sp.]
MMKKVPADELKKRMDGFKHQMDNCHPDWEIAAIFTNINMYYFTGTMQDGVLLIPREEEPVLWVRRSYKRALEESLFPYINSMDSFRNIAHTLSYFPEEVFLETESLPVGLYHRFCKYFPFNKINSADPVINKLRSLKSKYELDLMKKAGKIQGRVLEEMVPSLLKTGITESQLTATIYQLMIQEGHHGVTRFGMFDTQMVLGQICFGDSSIYPSYLNSPGGNYGSPAVPLFASNRKLKEGEVVFVDVGCGVQGYHTDKTMTYLFKGSLPQSAREDHERCVHIQNKMASLLKPGAIPAEIYQQIMDDLEPAFLENFMGYGDNQVKFLGHGIGLLIDEIPVIAPGFLEPLQEGMVLALEPKKGIKDLGMVGIENTFIVTKKGGKCITGDNPGMINIH